MIKYGETFMFADEDDPKGHLHIIITTPSANGEVVTVPVTTPNSKSDTMTTLNVGDHPRIKHLSVLAFSFARIRTIAQIEGLINSFDAKKCPAIKEDVLERCRNGTLESDHTPNEVRAFLRLTANLNQSSGG